MKAVADEFITVRNGLYIASLLDSTRKHYIKSRLRPIDRYQ